MTITQDAPPDVAAVPGGTPRLNKALAAAQAEMPPIVKGEKGKQEGVSTTTGRPYSIEYEYADLGAIGAVAYPVLGKHGLSYSAQTDLTGDGKFVLRYQLRHDSGEMLAGVIPLPSGGKPQQLGILLTYYRRYAFQAVTGIHPVGDDDDAASANSDQRFDTGSAGEAWEQAIPAPGNRRRQEPRQDRPAQQDQRQQQSRPGRPPVTVPPLDPEDPWRAKIECISDAVEGKAARDEVAELLAAGTITQERANRLNAVLTVRGLEIEQQQRQNARADGQAAEQPPPIRPETQGAPKRERTTGGNNADWVADFKARVAAAALDELTGLQHEIPAAVRNRTILPEMSAELTQVIRARRHEASQEVPA